MSIKFNSPYISGKEADYISDAIYNRKQLSGNGYYTKKCHALLKSKYGFEHCLLTTSCTDALEIASLLIKIEEGDEVIMPSYTFVSTANPFILRGGVVKFGDSGKNHPNLTLAEIKRLVSPKTKAVVMVHYAGQASEIEEISAFCNQERIFLIEDAAQSIDTYFNGKPLGSFGDIAAFSFHDNKNISCGEGGLLVVNNKEMIERSEVLWEKGTNRAKFFRGEIDKYNWVDVGSSFLPSELNAAFLLGQLEDIDTVTQERRRLWNLYFDTLSELNSKDGVELPQVPLGSTNNGHIFYLVLEDKSKRDGLMAFLKEHKIESYFHYVPLHLSEFNLNSNPKISLKNAEKFSDHLLRLPLYVNLTSTQVNEVCDRVKEFFRVNN